MWTASSSTQQPDQFHMKAVSCRFVVKAGMDVAYTFVKSSIGYPAGRLGGGTTEIVLLVCLGPIRMQPSWAL